MEYRGAKIEPFDQVRLLTHNGIWNRVGIVRHRYEDGSLDVGVPHPNSKVERIFKVREDQVERIAVLRKSTHTGTMAEAVEVFKKGNAAARRLAGKTFVEGENK